MIKGSSAARLLLLLMLLPSHVRSDVPRCAAFTASLSDKGTQDLSPPLRIDKVRLILALGKTTHSAAAHKKCEEEESKEEQLVRQ